MTSVPMNGAIPRTARPVARSRVKSLRRPATWALAIIAAIFVLEYHTYFVTSYFWDRVIKLGALAVLVFAFPYRQISGKAWITLLTYGALFATAMVGALASGTIYVGTLQLAKIVLAFLILPLILFRFRAQDRLPSPLLKVLWIFAIVFAVQAAVAVALVRLGTPPTPTYLMIERLDMLQRTFGILGYASTFGVREEGFLFFRPQAWFTEPSYLASFYHFPTLLAFGYYFEQRRMRHLVLGLILLAALAMTFSLGGYISFTAAFIALLLVRPRKRAGVFLKFVAPIAVAVAFVFAASGIMNYTHDLYAKSELEGMSTATHMLGRKPEQKLIQDYFRVKETFALIVDKPVGIGLAHTLGYSDLTSPSAPMYWAVAGGFLALLVLVLLYWQLVYWYAVPLLMSQSPIDRTIAAAFIAVTVQSLQVSTWVQPLYMYIVAVMMLATMSLRMRQHRQARAGQRA